eukprot:jgi/Chrzof1/14399/Cz09g01040.t1
MSIASSTYKAADNELATRDPSHPSHSQQSAGHTALDTVLKFNLKSNPSETRSLVADIQTYLSQSSVEKVIAEAALARQQQQHSATLEPQTSSQPALRHEQGGTDQQNIHATSAHEQAAEHAAVADQAQQLQTQADTAASTIASAPAASAAAGPACVSQSSFSFADSDDGEQEPDSPHMGDELKKQVQNLLQRTDSMLSRSSDKSGIQKSAPASPPQSRNASTASPGLPSPLPKNLFDFEPQAPSVETPTFRGQNSKENTGKRRGILKSDPGGMRFDSQGNTVSPASEAPSIGLGGLDNLSPTSDAPITPLRRLSTLPDFDRREYDYSGKFDSGRTTVVLDKSASFKASSREDSVYQNFAPLEELVNAVTESVIMPSVGKASVNIVSSRESGLTAHSREGSIYENFAPLEELVNAVTESANSTMHQAPTSPYDPAIVAAFNTYSQRFAPRLSAAGTDVSAGRLSAVSASEESPHKSKLAYMMGSEYIQTPTLSRLKSDLAAVMRKTPVPESQHFSDMASSLLQRLQQFDELEAASAQKFKQLLEALFEGIFSRASPSRQQGSAAPSATAAGGQNSTNAGSSNGDATTATSLPAAHSSDGATRGSNGVTAPSRRATMADADSAMGTVLAAISRQVTDAASLLMSKDKDAPGGVMSGNSIISPSDPMLQAAFAKLAQGQAMLKGLQPAAVDPAVALGVAQAPAGSPERRLSMTNARRRSTVDAAGLWVGQSARRGSVATPDVGISPALSRASSIGGVMTTALPSLGPQWGDVGGQPLMEVLNGGVHNAAARRVSMPDSVFGQGASPQQHQQSAVASRRTSRLLQTSQPSTSGVSSRQGSPTRASLAQMLGRSSPSLTHELPPGRFSITAGGADRYMGTPTPRLSYLDPGSNGNAPEVFNGFSHAPHNHQPRTNATEDHLAAGSKLSEFEGWGNHVVASLPSVGVLHTSTPISKQQPQPHSLISQLLSRMQGAAVNGTSTSQPQVMGVKHPRSSSVTPPDSAASHPSTPATTTSWLPASSAGYSQGDTRQVEARSLSRFGGMHASSSAPNLTQAACDTRASGSGSLAAGKTGHRQSGRLSPTLALLQRQQEYHQSQQQQQQQQQQYGHWDTHQQQQERHKQPHQQNGIQHPYVNHYLHPNQQQQQHLVPRTDPEASFLNHSSHPFMPVVAGELPTADTAMAADQVQLQPHAASTSVSNAYATWIATPDLPLHNRVQPARHIKASTPSAQSGIESGHASVRSPLVQSKFPFRSPVKQSELAGRAIGKAKSSPSHTVSLPDGVIDVYHDEVEFTSATPVVISISPIAAMSAESRSATPASPPFWQIMPAQMAVPWSV